VKMIPVFDPSSVVPYPIEFAHPGVRCRYFGTGNRLRRKFLDEHKGCWRPYKTKEDGVAVLQPRIEGSGIETAPGTASSCKLPCEARLNTNDTGVSPPTPTNWFNLQGAAAYLAVSEQTLSRYVKENTAPPSVKIGKGRRFHRGDLDAWIRVGGVLAFKRAER
jgi:excisionase family DNA binding protein